MAQTLTGQLAGQQSSVTFDGGKTDAQLANLNRLFVLDKATPPPAGLTPAQLSKYYLDAAMAEFKRYYRQEALKNLLRERAAEKQAIDDQAALDAAI